MGVPPIGMIDGSVLTAVGLLLMFSFIEKLPEAICNMQYASPCFFAKLIPWFIGCRDSSSVALV